MLGLVVHMPINSLKILLVSILSILHHAAAVYTPKINGFSSIDAFLVDAEQDTSPSLDSRINEHVRPLLPQAVFNSQDGTLNKAHEHKIKWILENPHFDILSRVASNLIPPYKSFYQSIIHNGLTELLNLDLLHEDSINFKYVMDCSTTLHPGVSRLYNRDILLNTRAKGTRLTLILQNDDLHSIVSPKKILSFQSEPFIHVSSADNGTSNTNPTFNIPELWLVPAWWFQGDSKTYVPASCKTKMNHPLTDETQPPAPFNWDNFLSAFNVQMYAGAKLNITVTVDENDVTRMFITASMNGLSEYQTENSGFASRGQIVGYISYIKLHVLKTNSLIKWFEFHRPISPLFGDMHLSTNLMLFKQCFVEGALRGRKHLAKMWNLDVQ